MLTETHEALVWLHCLPVADGMPRAAEAAPALAAVSAASGSQQVALGPAAAAAAASLGNLLDIRILGLHPRPTESEFLGAEPSSLCFHKPSR